MSLSLCPRLRYSLFKQCQKNKYFREGTTRIFSNLEHIQYPMSRAATNPINSNSITAFTAENMLCATSSVSHGRSKSSLYRKSSFKYKTASLKHSEIERTKFRKLKDRRLELLKSQKLVYNKTDKLQQKDEELKSTTIYPSDYKMTRDLKWFKTAAVALGNEQANTYRRLKTMPNVIMNKEDFSMHSMHDMGVQKCTNINKDAIYDDAIELQEPMSQQPGDEVASQPGATEGGAQIDAKDAKKAKEAEDVEFPKIFGKLASTLKKWFGKPEK